eukprot:scaffold86487_cov40-Prasinocladus_malaysianus.AAC.1
MSSLPDEPDASDVNGARIVVALPRQPQNDRRDNSLFRQLCVFQTALYDFVIVSVPEAAGGREFALKPSFPGAQELADLSQTLSEAGVVGAMLVMSWKD